MTPFEMFLTFYLATVTPLAGFLVSARFKRLETEISELRAGMQAEISELRHEMRAEISELRHEMRAEIAALRSDLTQLALAVGARPRASEG